MRRCHVKGRPKSWVHWAPVWTLPLLFFLFTRLLAIRGIPETIKPSTLKPSAPGIAAGVFLGLLEDLLVVALLVSALVIVDWASRRLLHRAQRWVGERYRARVVLRWTHHALRFAVVLALVVATLAPCAYDLVLVRAHHTRLSTELSMPSNLEHDTEAAGGLATIVMIGTTVYCVAASLLFVCVIDLGCCLPTWRSVRSHKDNETAYVTPTYLHLGFCGYKSPSRDPHLGRECSPSEEVDSTDEADERHVTIVSAPSCTSEDEEQAETSSMPLPSPDRVSFPTSTNRQLSSPVRTLVGVSVVVGAFALVSFVVCAISKDTSPLVAAIALNATLNELCHLLLGAQFMPADALTTQGVDPTYSRLLRRV